MSYKQRRYRQLIEMLSPEERTNRNIVSELCLNAAIAETIHFDILGCDATSIVICDEPLFNPSRDEGHAFAALTKLAASDYSLQISTEYAPCRSKMPKLIRECGPPFKVEIFGSLRGYYQIAQDQRGKRLACAEGNFGDEAEVICNALEQIINWEAGNRRNKPISWDKEWEPK